MNKFKAGDAITGQNFNYEARYNGMNGVIQNNMGEMVSEGKASGKKQRGNHYMVLWDNGMCEPQIEFRLRKKKPPQETSTWEEVQAIEGLGGWNPSKVSKSLTVTEK